MPAIFEATFRRLDVLVRVDILERRRRNNWRLVEVKSSVEAKDHHVYDVAIQHHVVQGCGLDISSPCLMHLNRNYVYDGKSYDARELFIIEDLTRRVREVGAICQNYCVSNSARWRGINRQMSNPACNATIHTSASSSATAILIHPKLIFRSFRASAIGSGRI